MYHSAVILPQTLVIGSQLLAQLHPTHACAQSPYRRHVPNDQLAVHTSRADFGHRTIGTSLVRSHARNRVLVHGQQFRVSARRNRRRRPRGIARPTRVGVPECVERRTVEATHAPDACSWGCGFGCRWIVQRTDSLPASFSSLEENGLAVVTSGDERILGRPGEGDVGQGGCFDRNDGRSSGIYDSHGRIVA